MPDTATSIKYFASVVAIPGIFLCLMGLGIVPLDEKMGLMSAPFIDPIGVPLQPFSLFLGSSNIMGVLSLWGKGPMPKTLGRIELMIASACGAYAHTAVEESPAFALLFFCLIAYLFVLDNQKPIEEENKSIKVKA